MGWKRGCQPFSCPWSENVTYCRKEICSTYLFKASIAAIPLANAKHQFPTRSLRSLRAAVRSTSSALCLYYACKRSHPFVEDSGFVSYAEKHRFGHGVVVSKICCYNAVIVLSGQNGWGEHKGVLAHEALQSSYRVGRVRTKALGFVEPCCLPGGFVTIAVENKPVSS